MRSAPPLRWRRRAVAVAGALALGASLMTATAASAGDDPRVGLGPGLSDAEIAASGVELLESLPLPAGFSINSDLAFKGDRAIVGGFSGFQVYDVSDPAAPVLETAFVCPGGQGDVSVHGDLLFMSVEATNGRIDCGTQGAGGLVNPERFRGVRIFDISDLSSPQQLPGVQTCRGSHTHTLVTDPDDTENVYIYNSGTSSVRPSAELAGCENAALTAEPVTEGNPTQWRIDVIKVPLAAPETASIVSQPRIFTDAGTGAYNGLQNTLPGALHPSGTAYSPLPNTNTCHDVTAFPEIELLAGACQGNGILVDISDPVNPVRLDAVADPNFSYWHSATFSNDGSKVIFTDEWGGGTQARCQEIHEPEWGANALFEIVDGKFEFASYYKLPVPQTATENCVAHNGSIIPVPGRDIMVQAWYQGGMSIFDFTDTENPVEIAYLDRGPISASALTLGGYWSTYWYNGNVLGSEIARGFDTMALAETDAMSANEIAAAGEIQLDEFNAQTQSELVHAPSFAVAGSYVDQAERAGTLSAKALAQVRKHLAEAQVLVEDGSSSRAVIAQLDNAIRKSGAPADSPVVQAITELKATFS
ncbi:MULTISPECIES: LVIVD repeat-containing protein [unclassified Agromyces]|uniref:LVIVD repeat-containing protein n=1 Tax=unclassified Agromyces TaxID=2639701 RepID=UPI003014BA47